MDKGEWENIEDIIDETLKRSKEKRADYIKTRCKGNPQLKEKVITYLRAIESSDGFLEN